MPPTVAPLQVSVPPLAARRNCLNPSRDSFESMPQVTKISGMAVIVEIMPIGGPSPAPKTNLLAHRRVLKLPVAAIAEQRIAHRMAFISIWQLLRWRKLRIMHNALTRISPHVCDIQISPPVAIVIKPSGAHAGADIFHARLCRFVAKLPFVIDVQILAPEIVGYI